MHQLIGTFDTARLLSQAVVQAGDLLGLVRAEVARILGFKCADISGLYQGRLLLSPDTEAWQQAQLFVRFYQALYRYKTGNEAQMIHWLRADNVVLATSPFYLLVDHGQLAWVLAYLEQSFL